MGSATGGEKRLKRPDGLRIFVGLVIIMVATAVVAGLYLSGSPSKERERRSDRERVSDLQYLATTIDAHYSRVGVLPENLTDLELGGTEQFTDAVSDPVTGDRYDYRTTGQLSYELCGRFDHPSEKDEEGRYYPPEPRPVSPLGTDVKIRDWTHPAGDFCFGLEVQRYGIPDVCSVVDPCPFGQTCAVLPGSPGAVCVPEGKECLAAGCPEDCRIAESYPVQVSCGQENDTGGDSCHLRRHVRTGEIGCFGCSEGVCRRPDADWEVYELPEDNLGIPYACYPTPDGCALAQ
ncbi:hypothetical protein AMJ57_00910 [Parcubacteria bacterium SG8_24]|nr:MAG: hypothetical protein AMJ57_00910 [Parcubacteria bacterium SG8_24]